MRKRKAYVFRFFFIMGKVIASKAKQSHKKLEAVEELETQRR